MIVKTKPLDRDESKVLELIRKSKDGLVTTLGVPRVWRGHLRRTALARAVQASNTIEGYNVTVEDAMALAEDEDSLGGDRETVLAVRGYQRAMTYVLQRALEPDFSCSVETLKSLHFMMLEHDLSKNPGRWRPGWAAVTDGETGGIAYEGAPVQDVGSLIDELVDAINEQDSADPIVRAAMAHLNLVLIHPFSDGNGRMARCVQSLVLAMFGTLDPVFSSIEEYLGSHTPTYYAVLRAVGGRSWSSESDGRPWIRFCLTAHHHQIMLQLRREREMAATWDACERLIERHGLPGRTILALSDSATGWKVRNATYRPAADLTHATASRDLKALVDADLLVAFGEKRGRFYGPGKELLQVRERVRSSRREELVDPFDT